ncbi:protein CHROMATIN REMODELING 35-like, partial [Lolium rigidum]|uniref:protein CHROMATIN REMODELING 35-like n=1 Tax=Lolium rigidum TaxID=89674 RepID=UPI001F5DEF6C
SVGLYYRRKIKASDPVSGLSLPTANTGRSLGCGSVTKDSGSSYARKVQVMNIISTLCDPTPNYLASAETKLINGSIEQTEQKKEVIIILDSDDEDESTAGYQQLTPEKKQQLTPEKSKQLIQSEWTGTLTTCATTKGIDEVIETTLGRDQNSRIAPYGQSAALMTRYPWSSYQPSAHFERVILHERPEEERKQDLAAASYAERIAETKKNLSLPKEREQRKLDLSSHVDGNAETVPRKRKNEGKNEANPAVLDLPSETYSSVEEDEPMEEEDKPERESDGLEDFWNDFSLAIESSKLDTLEEVASEKEVTKQEVDTDCNHDIRIHEDLGHVCRVCGMIVRRADTIIDYQWKKASRSRSYFCETRSKDADEIAIGDVRVAEELTVLDIAIHPRHAKHMRPHQLAGFHFLVKNLVSEKPGGCILAHAPGSGKTFMLISFIQSFLAKYPSARPLVILPKGILGTWKREFQRWQVEDIPLYDFYSVKADKRADQLEILNSWQAKMSVLFLGYTQFSQIICSDGGGTVAAACRNMLLMVPNLLIMDEGHTPRNRETNVLESLSRVQTPRKVILSGTLFQNHVREVFNILNLVRPQFLKMERSRPIVRRIMCQVAMSGSRISKAVAGNVFTESVEETLLNDDNFVRKAHVIRSLRELTKDVLHYYKGDILEELPGLVDFSVFLKLSPKQKQIVHKLEAYENFKGSAVGAALYMHPCLSEISEVAAADRSINSTDATIDSLVQYINVTDGVKARFFTNILVLANSAGEKVLAFGQYILPMKFLERLLVKTKGWHVGKEIFVISGDTSPEERDLAMEQFNNSADAKVLFGSIKACGEGISLVGASRVVILDVHLNPSVTRQAIGRAFRPGQHKKVFVYRLVAADSLEENFHETAFKKEVIPKLWFEWSEQHCTSEEGFKLNNVDIDNCEDELLDNKTMRQDIKALYRR